ncbi:MAG: fibrobacter succinogenes major paralogous domain-containing protein, partial [Bacteroidales bacterium]|nr:fibrobacter succinogenes major paralogous domain-containing protein [Bacteroidales bacterium]
IRHGGCYMELPDLGTPLFSTTTSLQMNEVTISNNAPANHLYPAGETVVTWVAKSLCGDSITCEQKINVSFAPCSDAVDYEGNHYPAVRLGSGCKCWTTENLKSTKYSDGRAIEDVMSYYSSQFPNTTENVNIFGHLYNWYAAADTQRYGSVDSVERAYNLGHRIQGICPEGWYLPTDEDFEELNMYPVNDLRSTSYWINGGNNTNATGFNSLPGGMYNCATSRYEDGMGISFYWSCHPVFDLASGALMDYVCERIREENFSRCNGFSVRCVKEEQ